MLAGLALTVGKIFGSKSVVDGAISGIDKMFYTNEEREDAKLQLLKSYEPFKLALRLLALIITIPFVLMVIALFVMTLATTSVAATASTAAAYLLLKDTLMIPFTAVIGFYFMDGIGILKGKKKIK